jgi:hypothetical protein
VTERSLLAVERDPGRYDLYGGAACEERLLTADRTMEALLSDHVDFLVHETLRRRDRGGTETYRILRFAIPTSRGVVDGGEWVGRGALVAVRYRLDPEDDGYVRGWFEGVRETLGDLIDRGSLTVREAFDHLDDAVRRFGSDREVLFDPGR